ncbi:relaxase/mobilization nuclease domain-containing protein, partial [Staphylococcus epidermidis]
MATTKLSATKSTLRAINYAEKLAPNHQVAVYTHADTNHVHNHIVLNSIDLNTGKKFNNNKQALRDVRAFN